MSKTKAAQTKKSDTNEIRWRLHQAQGALAYTLVVFGDGLRKKQGWKNDLSGIDAVHYYLMQKHHWTPAQVRSMSYDDLRFALTEEMQGWTLPADAR